MLFLSVVLQVFSDSRLLRLRSRVLRQGKCLIDQCSPFILPPPFIYGTFAAVSCHLSSSFFCFCLSLLRSATASSWSHEKDLFIQCALTRWGFKVAELAVGAVCVAVPPSPHLKQSLLGPHWQNNFFFFLPPNLILGARRITFAETFSQKNQPKPDTQHGFLQCLKVGKKQKF